VDAIAPRRADLVEHTRADHARTVLVDWMLGNACSYACSYCPKALHDGSIRWQAEADVLAFYERLHAHYVVRRGRRVWIQFTGGEPTMHPRIVPLLEAATARGLTVSLISNASRTRRFWEKIAPHLDSAILTYHVEFAEPDHFGAVAALLAARMPVHINVTMPPDRFEATLGAARRLRDALPSASITLKPLRVGFETTLYDYAPDQLRIMSDGLPAPVPPPGATPRATMTVSGGDAPPVQRRANEFVIRGENRWHGWRCNAGLESLRVKGDGTLTRAVCGVGGTIGRLDGEIALPADPVLCTADVCGCVADILITKARYGG
jgi:hypothetical protein